MQARAFAAVLIRLFFVLLPAAASRAEHHVLASTPKTVHWGQYDASLPPVLRIRSGDTVEITSAFIDTPGALEAAGLKAAEIEASHRAIHNEVKDRGPGPHVLTGPIYVEGAEPGDTLEVHIESIALALPYAVNLFLPGMGVLPEDFPYAYRKLVRLDRERRIARFAPGVEIPLRPFFGSMGVAPPPELGRISSAPPWIHAGNLDNKELVAGATLFIPVHARGALFSAGDAHAAQGNGEVSLTALETVLTGRFRLTVRKNRPPLKWPLAETPAHYITMGFDESLDTATKIALREMIDLISSRFNLSRADAYHLASDAVDFNITQLVDGKRGVHAMLPKSLFTATKGQ